MSFKEEHSLNPIIPVDSIHECLRQSNPDIEVSMLNSSAFKSTAVLVVGNHGPFRLVWLLGSGASCHLCNDVHLFINFKPCNVKISTAKAGDPIVATP